MVVFPEWRMDLRARPWSIVGSLRLGVAKGPRGWTVGGDDGWGSVRIRKRRRRLGTSVPTRWLGWAVTGRASILPS